MNTFHSSGFLYALIYIIYVFNHKQFIREGVLFVGVDYQIFPFGNSIDTQRGKMYHRILSQSEPTSNLQSIISRNFDMPNFEPRQVVVVTHEEVPQLRSLDSSIVSH